MALLQALADTGSAAASVSPAKEALRPTQAKASPSKDAIHFQQQPKKVSRHWSSMTCPDSRSWVQLQTAGFTGPGPQLQAAVFWTEGDECKGFRLSRPGREPEQYKRSGGAPEQCSLG